jgi:hypothetical protein
MNIFTDEFINGPLINYFDICSSNNHEFNFPTTTNELHNLNKGLVILKKMYITSEFRQYMPIIIFNQFDIEIKDLDSFVEENIKKIITLFKERILFSFNININQNILNKYKYYIKTK